MTTGSCSERAARTIFDGFMSLFRTYNFQRHKYLLIARQRTLPCTCLLKYIIKQLAIVFYEVS